MGAYCCKNDAADVYYPSPLAANGIATCLSAGDLRPYISAYQSETELQNFDSALYKRTTRVLDTLSDNHEVRSLSLESLRAMTGCFSEVNQEVVKHVLKSKRDVWDCPELLDLVQQYFDYSHQVLAFFNTLNTCLKDAQNRQLIISLALRYFEEESKVVDGVESSNGVRFERTIQELRSFKAEGNPFNEEFSQSFQAVLTQQMLMLNKLTAQRKKLNQKTKSMKTYKKVSLVIFAACFVGVIIFSVVAAVIAVPPLVTGLVAAMSAPIGGMGKWMNSMWAKCEKQIKAQADMIGIVENWTKLTVAELVNIGALVSKLEIEIEALLNNAALSLRDDSTVELVIADVSRRLEGLREGISALEEDANTYSRDIRQARTVILEGMNRHPE